MDFNQFIYNLLNIIGDTSFNEFKQKQIKECVHNSNMDDYVRYGTNRVCVIVPKVFEEQIIPQQLQGKGSFVLKFPYNGTAGYSDNIREMEVSQKVNVLNLFATSYGFLFDGKVLLQEKLKGIETEQEMKNNLSSLKDFYNICSRNGIVIKDGTSLAHLNFGLSEYDNKLKSLDYAYYNVLSVPTQQNQNKVFLRCPTCNVGKLTYINKVRAGVTGKLQSHDIEEGYCCDNAACVSNYKEATKEIKLLITPESVTGVITGK